MSKSTPIQEHIWMLLNITQRRIYRRIEMSLSAKGLPSQKWYDVLWELERSPEGLRPYHLEQKLLFEQSNFSRQSQKMIEEGLIEKVLLETDGRGRVLKITKKGLEVRASIWVEYSQLLAENLGQVDEKHAQQLADLLRKLN